MKMEPKKETRVREVLVNSDHQGNYSRLVLSPTRCEVKVRRGENVSLFTRLGEYINKTAPKVKMTHRGEILKTEDGKGFFCRTVTKSQNKHYYCFKVSYEDLNK